MAEPGNRLRHEKSPYLLQHAQNPVDWFPWDAEAFERAAAEDKPVFLSIGYSTCHWCHVMERESFEDPDVAALMNEAFVSIKVDREERPDIDGVYMTVAQMLTGAGGWPLTVIMTPDKRPFFAGTYFPKHSQPGRIGMLDLVPRIEQLWATRRDDVLSSAAQITRSLSHPPQSRGTTDLSEETLRVASRQLSRVFDETWGGFGQAPKFPTPHNLSFLLRYWSRTGETDALRMVEGSLQAMQAGGIWDHVGFGFHRYSTDPRWLVPHFEKMLYDQALLAIAYAEAYQATGRPDFRVTGEHILEYIDRDLTHAGGGFYSAEDADSEGEEGKFYLWTAAELEELLEPSEARLLSDVYGVEDVGNFRDEATRRLTGANILFLRRPLESVAESEGLPDDELRDRLSAAREVLRAVREKRVRPHLDDKILTDWNGLMIAALSIASVAFEEVALRERADAALAFVLDNLRLPDGRLLHRYRDGVAGIPANLDDYAFMVWGLIELYEAGYEARHLVTALELTEVQLRHFWDDDRGGFFFSADDGERLLVRQREIYDGAIPSGNSVSALNLLRLGRITGRAELEDRGRAVLSAFAAEVSPGPGSHTQLMSALDFSLGPTREIVIAGEPRAADTEALLRIAREGFAPRRVTVFRSVGGDGDEIERLAPYAAAMGTVGDRAAAYVCENYACLRPVTEPQEFRELLAD
jgi:uncharacterized protein YyaL (SSP411 family)